MDAEFKPFYKGFQYGNIGCGASSLGIQNYIDFTVKNDSFKEILYSFWNALMLEIIKKNKMGPTFVSLVQFSGLFRKPELYKDKGQLILICPFVVFKSPKKQQNFCHWISALASKKRSNQKSSVRSRVKIKSCN